MQQFGFWLLAVVSVATALAVIINRNPVRCALFLVLNFICLAVLYLMLDAQLLAALQVLVYAGAIMVLFLFVIMLLNLGGEQIQHDPLVGQRPLAALFGIALLLSLGTTFQQWAIQAPAPQVTPADDQIRVLGQQLFVKYVYPFEVTSILLLVGIIGTILLAKRKLGEKRKVEPEPAPLTYVEGPIAAREAAAPVATIAAGRGEE
jgi:NADH-quinone oxidoreductase subunit J